jgi:hypothetical protein
MTETIRLEIKKPLVIGKVSDESFEMTAIVDDLHINIYLPASGCDGSRMQIGVSKVGNYGMTIVYVHTVNDIVNLFSYYGAGLEDTLIKELNDFYNKWSGQDGTVTISLHTIGGLCEC